MARLTTNDIPDVAIVDPTMMLSMPKLLSAATGMGFSNVGLGIVHSMDHPLGAFYDTPHEIANAIILPTVMKYNTPMTGDKFKYIAKAMGVENAFQMNE